MPDKPEKPVTFPYKTLEAASKDAFKKLGGPEQAFAYLVKGYKTTAWRKKATENERAVRKAHEAAVAAANGAPTKSS